MILRFLFYAFLIYLAFRLIFNFIVPVVRTACQVKKGFKEMNEKMQASQDNYRPKAEQPSFSTTANPRSGDYIDFEEMKD